MYRVRGRFERLDAPASDRWTLSIFGIGLLMLTLPTYWVLSRTIWASDEQGHGPIILVVTIWLAWIRRQQFFDLPEKPSYTLGCLAFFAGSIIYVIGRSQKVDTLEVSSHLLLITAALLLTKGISGLRWGAFFLFLLLFMVPLPGLVVLTITTPLKIAVSNLAEVFIYAAGLPVARDGVIIYIGNYQLLVADACSGLNSMFTLEALGLVYMSITSSTSAQRNVALALLIIPIAFAANVIRVIALILITFYFGDDVGQSFAHSFAGVALFIVGVCLMMSADNLLRLLFKDKHQEPKLATSGKPPSRLSTE